MRVKLLNPDFEEFQTILGISYLFIYGEGKVKPPEEREKINSVSKESNNDLITPIKTETLLKKLEINNSNNSNPNKKSMDKSDSNSSMKKMFEERAKSLIPDQSVKSIFKERNLNLKEEKYF